MKKNVGYRVKLFDEKSTEETENAINNFLKPFDVPEDSGEYPVCPAYYPLGGHRIMLVYPVMKEV